MAVIARAKTCGLSVMCTPRVVSYIYDEAFGIVAYRQMNEILVCLIVAARISYWTIEYKHRSYTSGRRLLHVMSDVSYCRLYDAPGSLGLATPRHFWC